MEDKKNVSVGVGLVKFVETVKNGNPNEPILLMNIISDGTYENICWQRRSDGLFVESNSDNTVTFTESGTYQLVVRYNNGSYPQHEFYDIIIS